MEIGDKVIVKILGSDILNSIYSSITDCALAKATKRQFDKYNVIVGGATIAIGTKDFKIDTDKFNSRIFEDLKNTITTNEFNEVVLEVELTYYDNIRD